jgi:hypothetical protein
VKSIGQILVFKMSSGSSEGFSVRRGSPIAVRSRSPIITGAAAASTGRSSSMGSTGNVPTRGRGSPADHIPKSSHVHTPHTAPKPDETPRDAKATYFTKFGKVRLSSKKDSLLWTEYRSLLNVSEQAGVQSQKIVKPLDGVVSALANGRQIQVKSDLETLFVLERALGRPALEVIGNKFNQLAASEGAIVTGTNDKNGVSSCILKDLKFNPNAKDFVVDPSDDTKNIEIQGRPYSYSSTHFNADNLDLFGVFAAKNYKGGRSLLSVTKAAKYVAPFGDITLPVGNLSAKPATAEEAKNRYLMSLKTRSEVPFYALIGLTTKGAKRTYVRKDFDNYQANVAGAYYPHPGVAKKDMTYRGTLFEFTPLNDQGQLTGASDSYMLSEITQSLKDAGAELTVPKLTKGVQKTVAKMVDGEAVAVPATMAKKLSPEHIAEWMFYSSLETA